MNRRAQGAAGEARALQYLQEKGMEPVARNVRCGGGEIDLIVRDGRYLVFVEVKQRASGRMGQGREAVDAKKRARSRFASSPKEFAFFSARGEAGEPSSTLAP